MAPGAAKPGSMTFRQMLLSRMLISQPSFYLDLSNYSKPIKTLSENIYGIPSAALDIQLCGTPKIAELMLLRTRIASKAETIIK